MPGSYVQLCWQNEFNKKNVREKTKPREIHNDKRSRIIVDRAVTMATPRGYPLILFSHILFDCDLLVLSLSHSHTPAYPSRHRRYPSPRLPLFICIYILARSRGKRSSHPRRILGVPCSFLDRNPTHDFPNIHRHRVYLL